MRGSAPYPIRGFEKALIQRAICLPVKTTPETGTKKPPDPVHDPLRRLVRRPVPRGGKSVPCGFLLPPSLHTRETSRNLLRLFPFSLKVFEGKPLSGSRMFSLFSFALQQKTAGTFSSFSLSLKVFEGGHPFRGQGCSAFSPLPSVDKGTYGSCRAPRRGKGVLRLLDMGSFNPSTENSRHPFRFSLFFESF